MDIWLDKEVFGSLAAHLINNRQPFKSLLRNKHFLNRIFRMQLSLQLLSLFSFRNQLTFLFNIRGMKSFEGLNVLRERGLMVDYSFQLFILFFKQMDSFFVLLNHLLTFQLYPLRKLCNLLVLYYNSLIKVCSQIIFSLPIFLLNFL